MKSHDGCICVCHWLGLLQPSFSTLKVILLLHSSLMISRTNCFLQNSLVTWLSHCCGPTEHLMNLSPHIAVAPALHISKTSTPPCNFLLKSLDTSEWGREQSLWVLTAVWDILGWTRTEVMLQRTLQLWRMEAVDTRTLYSHLLSGHLGGAQEMLFTVSMNWIR